MGYFLAMSDARNDAHNIAIKALAYLAGDPDRLLRFLQLTGLTPETLKQCANEPETMIAIIDHLLADETLLMSFSANAAVRPEAVLAAYHRLADQPPPEQPAMKWKGIDTN